MFWENKIYLFSDKNKLVFVKIKLSHEKRENQLKTTFSSESN